MLTPLLIPLILLVVVYALTLGYLSRGLRYLRREANASGRLPSVTVIVPARNEARHLDYLFDCLQRQDYPHQLLEFCLVDDRSSDETYCRMEAFARECPQALVLRITDTVPQLAPKKRAIDRAIRHSHGDVLVLTDADSRPGPSWVRVTAQRFADEEVAMVCGYAPYRPRCSTWQKLMALEYFSLAAVSAAGLGVGVALTCNGGNLAYRRRAYDVIGGFQKMASFISGDDDLLLHEMHRRRVGKLMYLAEPSAAVPTKPPASWREFFWQRVRYASKARHYRPVLTAGLIALYGMNFMLVGGLLVALALGKPTWLGAIGSLWAVKALAEFLFLRRAAVAMAERPLLAHLPVAALLHPFYVVLFGALGQFLPFQWKGERLRRRLPTPEFAKAAR